MASCVNCLETVREYARTRGANCGWGNPAIKGLRATPVLYWLRQRQLGATAVDPLKHDGSHPTDAHCTAVSEDQKIISQRSSSTAIGAKA